MRLTGGSICMLNMMGKKGRALLAAVGLGVLLAAGCGDAGFQAITRPGNTLTITVADMERLSQLRYSVKVHDRVLKHFRFAPSREGSEVVALRIRLINYTAIKTIVTLDEEAALLEDFFGGVYVPVDIGVVGEVWTRSDSGWGWVSNSMAADVPNYGKDEDVPTPPGWNDGPVRSIQLQGKKAKAGEGFLAGSIEIEQGKSIDGWMVFEAPEGTQFKELRWRAVDSILIPF